MNIVTVVNFIRSADDRMERCEMKDAVENQVRLALEYNMPTTFLLQPDAVTDPEYTNMIPKADNIEIGLWLELNRTLVLEAGGNWLAGDKEWQWYSGIDLMCGYEPEIRKKIIDIAMRDFKKVFGFYPKTVGSWSVDCVSLEYMEKTYSVTGSLNCKEQWGTDSYTLWGGYINQAYYPSRKNAFTPASEKENQINIPVFRMLGCDMADQYDQDVTDNGQMVLTLEPVPPGAGSDKKWVEWFFEQMIENPPLSFGYTQVGQENAFGWSAMKKGYELQIEYIAELEAQGKINIMTVEDAAAYYKGRYDKTPPSANIARKGDKDAVWISTSDYRFGFYADSDVMYIRDIQIFDDDYCERYLNDVCELKSSVYDNIPLVDGFIWCGCKSTKNCGLFFEKDGKILSGKADVTFEETAVGDCISQINIKCDDENICVEFCENKIVFYTECSLKWVYDEKNSRAVLDFKDYGIDIVHNGFKRNVGICGKINTTDKSISPLNGKIEINI